jgi:glycine/D-amino acid oxidase-like deaminating enzyme
MKNFAHVSSMVRSNNIQCDFRRLSGCLGFWNETYFEEAKRDLTLASVKHAELVRIVEDAQQLRELGLKGDVKGAIVQSVAASLSPYKLCVSIWETMLRRFETKTQSSAGRETESEGKSVTLNLQTTTAVTSLERLQEDDDVRQEGYRWKLNTLRGCVHARSVVLATNGYTSHLLSEFAPLIRPVQAQMSALIPPSTSPSNRDRGRTLIPMSYGFEGVGTMDRVMSDYLVQNPFISRTASEQRTNSASDIEEGGHLMFGGGRHLAFNHGEQCWDDDFVDKSVEKYLRTLPERLDLVFGTDTETGRYSENESTAQHASLDIAASWTGIIGHSADGHPWVGAVPDRPGIFLCGGYTGHGMTNAPLCGRYIGTIALEDLRSRLEGYDAARPATGHRSQDMMMPELDVDVPAEYLISRERIETVSRGN